MIANLAGMVIVTLAQTRWRLTQVGAKRRRGTFALIVAGLIGALSWANAEWLNLHGLMGLALFLIAVGLFAAAVLLTKSRESTASASELWGSSSQDPAAAEPTGQHSLQAPDGKLPRQTTR